MNKRKAKKARKKVVYPFVDEMNLLTMNEEDRKEALADFERYVQKYYRYFHYRDKEKLMRKRCAYYFPVGASTKNFYEELYKTARRHPASTVSLPQS